MGLMLFLRGEKIHSFVENVDENKAVELQEKHKNAVFLESGVIDYPDKTKNYDLYYRNGEIVYVEVEPSEPQQTQLDRIEATVNGIAENGTNYNEMAAAITEGVNDV